MRLRPVLTCAALVAVLNVSSNPVGIGAAPDPLRVRATAAVTRGMEYLKRVQETDGSWGEYPGTTALAVTALMRNGRTEVNDTSVAKAVQYIVRATKPNGAIYSDANAATALPNYNTALCLTALALTRDPAYKGEIRRAQAYLENSQLGESTGLKPSDPAYGGIGYGNHPDRPDLSNLQMALEGLKDSGTPANAPVWKKAIVFLQRVQNRKESNDQAWAQDADNDGGFVYNSQGKSFANEGGKPHSYGSMSYAGLKSYIYCGVSKSDPRAVSAHDWIRAHYTVDSNPGMGDTSLYYYYHAMAKTLDVYGDKIVKDSSGAPHDWSRDLETKMLAIQRPDGSWYNDNARYWENQPPLVTSYTLIALSYCLKR